MLASVYRGHRPRSTHELRAWHAAAASVPVIQPELPIVDCHHHLYGATTDAHYYRLADLRADLDGGHRVLGTVYAEAYEFGWRDFGPLELRSVGEVAKVVQLADVPVPTTTGPCQVAAGIVSNVDMTLGDAAAEVIEHHLAAGQRRLRGIRHRGATDDGTVGRFMGERPAPGLFRQPPFRRAVSLLSGFGLTFDAWVYFTQLDDVIELADAVPNVTVVVDHVGGLLGVAEYAGQTADVLSVWERRLRALALRDNVRLKIGGLGTVECGFGFEHETLPPTSTQLLRAWKPVVDTCIEVFGSRRCMFESNFPVDKQSCSYTALWNAFKLATVGRSLDERRDLFYRTACRTYNLPELASEGDGWLASHLLPSADRY